MHVLSKIAVWMSTLAPLFMLASLLQRSICTPPEGGRSETVILKEQQARQLLLAPCARC